MLTALNKTIHTDYFNATLSAFADNWCALCTTASEVSLMSGNDHVGLLSIRRSSPTASMTRCPPMAAIDCASQGNLSCPRFVQIVAQQDTLPWCTYQQRVIRAVRYVPSMLLDPKP